MAGGRVLGGTNRGNRKIDPRLLLAESWSVSDDPPKVDTRAGGENTHTAHTALLSLHILSLVEFATFLMSVVQVSALCLRRTDILDTL